MFRKQRTYVQSLSLEDGVDDTGGTGKYPGDGAVGFGAAVLVEDAAVDGALDLGVGLGREYVVHSLLDVRTAQVELAEVRRVEEGGVVSAS